MTKIKLYFDCDGVILDTIRRAARMARKQGFNPNDSEDFHNFFLQVNWFTLIKNAGVLNDAFNKIRRIINEKKEDYDVVILSKYNPENPTEADAKRKLFSMFLPDVEVVLVPFFGHKHETVNPVGNIMIEDSESNADDWDKSGGVAVRLLMDREPDLAHNIINDIDDFENTEGVKRLLKTR